MAAIPFSATSKPSKSAIHSTFISSFITGSNHVGRRSRLFLISTSGSISCRARRKLRVENVAATDQHQESKDINATREGTLGAFPPDSASIASIIKYHAEFTPCFSMESLGLPKAFYATAESVRYMLIINWNATYEYYEKLNVKQAYYLSMEFLQGRALLNAIGNLELSGPYAEALEKLGHNLEDVARQEPDALGNGGLGRLASCLLDSLAMQNYPAWRYGLRYKYGLFKQQITKDGQEEVAENWLEV